MTDEMSAQPWPAEIEEFLEKVRGGASMDGARRALRLNSSIIRNYRRMPAFEAELSIARDEGADVLGESLLTIFDGTQDRTDIERAKELSNNIKWWLSKRHHHKYGDRLDVNVNATIDIGSALADARARAERPMRDLVVDAVPQVLDAQREPLRISPDTVSDVRQKIVTEPAVPDIFK